MTDTKSEAILNKVKMDLISQPIIVKLEKTAEEKRKRNRDKRYRRKLRGK